MKTIGLLSLLVTGGATVALGCGSDVELGTPSCDGSEPLARIDEDTTLERGGCYRVEGVTAVTDGARLTIEPGVILEMGADAAIEVREEGSIVAVGTEEQPIAFLGAVDEPGHWRSLNITSNDIDNELGFIDFLQGGSEETCCAVGREAAMVLIEDGGRVSIHDNTFELSGHNGLGVEPGATLTLFEYNSFFENDGAPVRIAANLAGSLDFESDYQGDPALPHGDNFIELQGGTIDTDATWPETNLPFRARSGLSVSGGDLTLLPGVRIEFDADEGLEISAEGSLWAEGTAELPILLSGAADDADNWLGVLVTNSSPDNRLAFAELYGGGADEWCCVVGGAAASLIVRQDARLTLTDSVIRNGRALGMRIRSTGRLEPFARNSFLDNGNAPLRIAASELHQLDAASTFAQEGEDIRVEVEGNDTTADGQWSAQDVPYLFLDADTRIASAIAVAPGTHLSFSANAGLWVAPGGSFRAESGEEPITFDSISGMAGSWKGLAFESNSADNVLSGVVIDGAGSEEWCCAVGREATAVLVEPNGQLTLTDSTLRRSAGWGVLARTDYVSLTESGNTYEELSSGDISLPGGD